MPILHYNSFQLLRIAALVLFVVEILEMHEMMRQEMWTFKTLLYLITNYFSAIILSLRDT